jgi:DNA-binding transcriptional ArsR family regulator
MAEVFEDIVSLDKLIHEPARLAILTALSGCKHADFLFLQNLTGLSKGNLSQHLTKLEQGGLLEIEKTFEGKVPRTIIRLSSKGKTAITEHWSRLEDLKQRAEEWQPAAPKRVARVA